MRLLLVLLLCVSFVYAGKPPTLWFRMHSYFEVSNATIKPTPTTIQNDVFGQAFTNLAKFGNSMFFPVTKTNAKILKVSTFPMSAEMSIGFWFYPLHALSGTSSAGTYFYLGYPSSGRTFIAYVANGTGWDLYVYDKSAGSTRFVVNNCSFTASNWHYFFWTISDNTKANNMILYMDGTVVSNLAVGRATGGHSNHFDIGMLEGNNTVGADAYIDNFMMWNYILSSNEHLRARSAERGAFHDN